MTNVGSRGESKANMEKISRLMDGDMPHTELAVTMRACSGEGRQAWQDYHLIGEALRGDLARESNCQTGFDDKLYSRICAAIADEPNVFVPAVARANKESRERSASPGSFEIGGPVQPSEVEATRGRWLNVGNGSAIWKPWALAASVATAAVVGWQTMVTQPRELAAARAAAQTMAAGASPSTSTLAAQTASMNRYLSAHTEAAPVTRLSGPRVYIQPVSNVSH